MSHPVRPTTSEPATAPDRTLPRWMVPLGAAAVLGLVFWIAGLAGGDDPEVATTLDPEALITPSTSASTTTGPIDVREGVNRRAATAEVVIPADIAGNLAIEGLSGHLVTVTGQGPSAQTLNLTPVGTTIGGYEQITLPAFGQGHALDASGRWLGFIGGEEAGSSDLWLVPLDASDALVLPEITSFAWDADRAASLGWFNPTQGSAAEYQRATLSVDGSIAHFEVSAVERNADLLTVTTTGMWRSFQFDTHGFVAFTDSSVGEVLSRRADIVAVSGTARTALIGSLALNDWSLYWSLLEEGTTTFLPWAPSDAFGAAWEGDSTTAFVGLDGGSSSWVEVWSTDGTLLDAFRTQYRVRDIAFSPDGRFLVMPGEGEGIHAALIYDLATRSLIAIAADDRVQFAGLVPEATFGLSPDPASTS
jgi:hypothetical protein